MMDVIHLQHERFTQTYKDPFRKIDELGPIQKILYHSLSRKI